MSAEVNAQQTTHSALRWVEGKITQFENTPMPFALNEVSPSSGANFLDPRVWANMFSRLIGNGCVDAALRITTFAPTTIYDIGAGACRQDCDQITDGVITIPRTACYLGYDVARIVGGTLGLAAEGTFLIVGGAAFLVWHGGGACLDCVGDLGGRIYQAIMR